MFAVLLATAASPEAGAAILAVIAALVAAVIVAVACQLASIAQGPILAALTFLLVLVVLLLL